MFSVLQLLQQQRQGGEVHAEQTTWNPSCTRAIQAERPHLMLASRPIHARTTKHDWPTMSLGSKERPRQKLYFINFFWLILLLMVH
jgi:hypothetical protein